MISPVFSSVPYKLQNLFSTFSVVRNDFFWEDIYNSCTEVLQYDVNNLGTGFFSTQVAIQTSAGFFLNDT